MKNLKKISVLGIILLLSFTSFSQDVPWNWATDSSYRRYSYDSISGPNLYIVPQYILVRGMRIDLEFRLSKRKNTWLGVAPQFFLAKEETSPDNNNNYTNNSSLDYGSYKDFVGVGTLLYYRAFLLDNTLDGIYLNFGANYCYFQGQIANSTPQATTTNNQNYIQTSTITSSKKYTNAAFSKLGPDFCIGYQANPLPRFYLDGYIGIGMRYTVLHTGESLPSELTNYVWSYGYTGVVPNVGFRVGITL